MQLRVIDTIEEFKAIESAWEALWKQSSSTVFQAYSINIEAYMQLLYQNTLQLILLEEKKSLKAIFPCYIDANKTLRFINDDHFDFCGPIISEGAVSNKLFKLFAKFIQENKKVTQVHFKNLFNTEISSLLNYHFKKRKSLFSEVQHCLIDDFKEWGQLTSSEKSELKRIKNKFSEATTIKLTAFPKKGLESLMSLMVKQGLRKQNFYNKSFIHWMESIFKKGLMEVWRFEQDGQLLSLSCHLVTKDSRIVWIDFYDPKPYANIAHYICFLENLEEKPISLGRGTYSYKMNNFNAMPVDLYSFYYSKSSLAFFISEIKRACKSYIKSFIN